MIGNIKYDQSPSPAPVPTPDVVQVNEKREEVRGGEKMIMPSSLGSKLLWFLGGLVAFTMGLFVWFWVTNPLIVTVTGTGKVSVPATAATFTVSVGVLGQDAGGALSELRTKVDNLKKIMNESDLGVAEIIESQVQLTPAGMVVAGANGYQAMMGMSVKTSYVSQVGDLVVKLYQNGATVVSQPVISVENQEELEKQALDQAIKESQKNLNEIAIKKLKPIRKILSMEQATSGTTAQGTKQADETSMDERAIANGTFEVARAVSVTYALW